MRKKSTWKKLLITSVISGLSFLSFGQVLLNEGFESGVFPPTGWTTMDLDGGPAINNWDTLDIVSYYGGQYPSHSGTYGAASRSWDATNGANFPDNWLITPQLTITNANTSLKFFGLGTWGAPNGATGDFLEIFVSTTGTGLADFTSLAPGQNFSTESWEEVNLSLAAYVGQNIYLAFRHYNCSDQEIILIDDIVVASPYEDLIVSNLRPIIEYTAIPSMYAPYNLTISADIISQGSLNAGAFDVISSIYLAPDFDNPVQTFTNSFPSLNIGDTLTINESYSVSTNALYVVSHEINSVTDGLPENNFDYNYDTINYTTGEYARDDVGSNLSSLGLGATSDGILGSIFDVVTPSILDSVFYAIAPTVAGGTVQVKISTVDVNGIPTGIYIGQSATVDVIQQFVDDGIAVLTSSITASGGGELNLAPGKYFIGVEEGNGADNMGLYHSDRIYKPNTSFASIDGGAFDTYENYSVFDVTPVLHNYLRAQESAPVITSNDTDNQACEGQSIELSSSATSGNQWYLNGNIIAGETNQTLNVIASGSYTVEVNSLISNVIDVLINPLPTIDAGIDAQLCSGLPYTQNATGASTYVWDNGLVNGATSILPVGTTTLNVIGTDANSCSNTDAVTITVLALPTITEGTATNPSACQMLDGSIVVDGSATGTLSWNGTASGNMNGTLPMTITGLGAGSYNISFNDGNLCGSNTLNVSLTDPGAVTPVITANGSTTFCEGGSVNISSDQATGITWSTGETTQSIDVSTTSSISVTYSNGGCSSSSNVIVVTVNPNPIISENTVSNPTSCSGTDGSISVNTSELGILYWMGESSGMIPVVGTPTLISGLSAGTYGLALVSNQNCTSNGIQVLLSDPNTVTPTISTSGSTTFCEGGSVTLTSSSSTGNTWSTGETTQSITVSSPGFYTVNTNDNGCSASSQAVNVIVNSNPTISLGTVSNPTTCGTSTGSVQINGTENGNLVWSGASSGNMNSVALPQTISNLPAGSYSINFVNDNSCSSNTINVGLSDPGAVTPAITANGATTFCEGGSVNISSDQASGITWSTGETTQSIDVSTSSSISVTYTNGGCSASSNVIVVTVNPNPIISENSSTNPTSCSGNDGTISINTSSNGTFSWTGTTSGSASSNGSPTTLTGFAAGTYDFTLVSATTCTSNTISVTLTDPNVVTPTVTASGPTTFCEGGSVTLTSSNADSYAWNDMQSSTSQSITVSTSGTYNVTTLFNGCNATSESIVVVVNSNPVVNGGQDLSVCLGNSVVLEGIGALTYQWSNGVVDGVPFEPTTTATYTVVGIDGNLCQGTDQVTIVVNVGDINGGNDQIICNGEAVTLSASNGTNFTWNNGVTNGVAFTPTQTTTYTVTGLATNGCSDTDDVLVTVNPMPAVNAGDDLTICIGAQATLIATGATSYTWTGGVTNGDPFTVTDTMTYTVVGTTNGCSSADDVTIFAMDCSGINEAGISNLQMFPNPTSSTLTIKADDLSSVSTIEVRDQVGRVILSNVSITSNEITMDLGSLASGTYYVNLIGAKVSTYPVQVNK